MSENHAENREAMKEETHARGEEGGDADEEEIILEPPVWVKIAAAGLALTGTFGAMIGFQFLLSFDSMDRIFKALVAAFLILGFGGLGAAGMVVKGRTWAAVVGIFITLALAVLVWVPTFYGVLAFSTFAGAACSAPTVVLLVISIPACRKVTRSRRALLSGL